MRPLWHARGGVRMALRRPRLRQPLPPTPSRITPARSCARPQMYSTQSSMEPVSRAAGAGHQRQSLIVVPAAVPGAQVKVRCSRRERIGIAGRRALADFAGGAVAVLAIFGTFACIAWQSI
jgi:hypothetical protein